MEIVHNYDNDHLDWLFHKNIFPPKESTSIMSGNGKGSHSHLEVHSLSSDQVFLSIPLKNFQRLVNGLLNVFFCFSLFNCSAV